ncbi:ubiquitin-like-specific protease 1 [Daucus carota subsp. sativus]
MLGQDPISLENKKVHDKRSKDVVTKPESKGSATQKNKGLGDENSTQNCRSLRYLLEQSNAKGTTFTFEQDGEPIYVTYEDVDQFLKRSWLNIPILEIFSKYIGKLCKELNDDRFAFMSPSRLVINHKREYNRIEDATQYMKHFLVANKDKRFIIAPYIQDDHWMLLLFCLDESVIYVFDSLRRERDIRLTTPARTAFKLYVPQGGKRNNTKEFLWSHTDVQCPQQEGGTECGFFVMRYMYEVVKLSQKNPNINWKEGLGSRRYLKKEINEVRELWAEYFTVECL